VFFSFWVLRCSSGFFWRSFWCSSGVLLVFFWVLLGSSGVLLCYRTPEERQKNARRTPEGTPEDPRRTQKEKNTSPPVSSQVGGEERDAPSETPPRHLPRPRSKIYFFSFLNGDGRPGASSCWLLVASLFSLKFLAYLFFSCVLGVCYYVLSAASFHFPIHFPCGCTTELPRVECHSIKNHS
jgi:hypothetical protein